MVNKTKIMELTKEFLYAIGENPEREGLLDTPKRVANMCEELFVVNEKDMNYTAFSNVNYNDMVLVKGIDFTSLCEHHLVPFFGQVHIGYIPDKQIIGLSKLARVVEKCSKKLQLQETLMQDIVMEMNDAISPKGIAICIEAKHLCMCMRGVKKINTSTITTMFTGTYNTSSIKDNFISLVLK